jgi:hypothetical protein
MIDTMAKNSVRDEIPFISLEPQSEALVIVESDPAARKQSEDAFLAPYAGGSDAENETFWLARTHVLLPGEQGELAHDFMARCEN